MSVYARIARLSHIRTVHARFFLHTRSLHPFIEANDLRACKFFKQLSVWEGAGKHHAVVVREKAIPRLVS